MESQKSTQTLAREYRANTLELLGRLGYATTRQIARGVWGVVTASTRKMATRTVNALLKAGLVTTKRADINNERLAALTAAGVGALSCGLPRQRRHARDWLRHAHNHRTAANSTFVAASTPVPEGRLKDWPGYTELEIRLESENLIAEARLRFLDDDNQEHNKIADTLLETPHGTVWVEVENNWRSDKDLKKLVAMLRAMFRTPPYQVAEVWLVVTAPGAKTIGARLRKKMTHDLADGLPRQLKERDARILGEGRIQVFELDHETLTLKKITF